MKRWPAAALLFLGLLQIAADALGMRSVKGFAAATQASPAPKVFSAVQGLETFSTRFFVDWQDDAGAWHSVPLTPETYARIRGPYNRRNVYGAVLAYGPVLAKDPQTQPMFEAVARFALCGEAPLLREMGIGQAPRRVRVRLEPRMGTPPEIARLMEPPCP